MWFRLAIFATLVLIGSCKVVEPITLIGNKAEPVDGDDSANIDRRSGTGVSSTELEAAFERLKEELAEVELMKAEIANMQGGGSDTMAALANARASNDALRKEFDALRLEHEKLASTDAGEAIAMANQATAENAKLQAEHAKMSESLETVAKEAASLQALLLEAKDADPDEKARIEVAHLAASIHDLTRVNTKADYTLATIKKQSEEDGVKAANEIAKLKAELEHVKNKNFNAECRELREEAAKTQKDLFALRQQHDSDTLKSTNEIRSLKESLAASKKLQVPPKECTVLAQHEGAAASEIEQLTKALSVAQENARGYKDQADNLRKSNEHLKSNAVLLQEQAANAKKLALDEAMSLQTDVGKLMGNARAEVDALTVRLGKATAHAEAHATAVTAIKSELTRQRELLAGAAGQGAEETPETRALAHALSLMLNTPMPRRDQILEFQEKANKTVLAPLEPAPPSSAPEGVALRKEETLPSSDSAPSPLINLQRACSCPENGSSGQRGDTAGTSGSVAPTGSLAAEVPPNELKILNVLNDALGASSSELSDTKATLNATLEKLRNSTATAEQSMQEASEAATRLVQANAQVEDLQKQLGAAAARTCSCSCSCS